MLAQQALTGIRYAAGSRVEGVWTPGATSVLSITGTMRPMKPYHVQFLPASVRSGGAWKLFVKAGETVLRTTSPDGQTQADRITYEGQELEVHSVKDNTAHTSGKPHHKYILVVAGVDE